MRRWSVWISPIIGFVNDKRERLLLNIEIENENVTMIAACSKTVHVFGNRERTVIRIETTHGDNELNPFLRGNPCPTVERIMG